MLLDFEIPSSLPVMTLRETVFFPQSILPLHIFEDRYRQMLEDVLRTDRLFAIACRDESAGADDCEEVPCEVATVGVVRASHENPDGTSNLVLQGVCRVRIVRFSDTPPYPTIEIEPRLTPGEYDSHRLSALRAQIRSMLEGEDRLANGVPEEFLGFLNSLDDLEAFIDLTAFATCRSVRTKQRLLEIVDLEDRYETFLAYLRKQQKTIRLQRRLQGSIDDDQIQLN